MDRLYREALKAAAGLCQIGRSLNPFVVTDLRDQPGQMLAADPNVDSEAGVEMLFNALRKQRDDGQLVAFALVSEVTVTDPNTNFSFDALRVLIEDCEPTVLCFLIPYREDDSSREYAQPKKFPAEAQVFFPNAE